MLGGGVGGRLDRGGLPCHEPGNVSDGVKYLGFNLTHGIESWSMGGRHIGDLLRSKVLN